MIMSATLWEDMSIIRYCRSRQFAASSYSLTPLNSCWTSGTRCIEGSEQACDDKQRRDYMVIVYD